MRLSTIDFGSLFSYAPWGTLDAHLRSKTFRTILKNDEYLVSRSTEILLIDDVVTRGATLLGVANKLADAFPNARIHGFAALRTISDPNQFIRINDSCVGKIKLIDNETYRDP